MFVDDQWGLRWRERKRPAMAIEEREEREKKKKKKRNKVEYWVTVYEGIGWGTVEEWNFFFNDD